MRKIVIILTVLLWSALLFQTWPSGGLTSPDEAGSVGLFVMLLMAVGMATLASFPLFATGAYLAAALAACFFGPFGFGVLPFFYGLGLLFLTWLAFRHWRSYREVATVDVPVLVDPANKQQKKRSTRPLQRSTQRPPQKSPRGRYRSLLAWGATIAVTIILVRYVFQPSLPEIEAFAPGAMLTGDGTAGEETPASAFPEIVAYVDEVFWRVLSVESLGQVPEDAESLAALYPASGQHILVRAKIENRSDAVRTYTGFKLVDSQGVVTGRSLPSLWLVPDGERCLVRVIQPGATQICTEIFRLSENAAGLQARVSDLKLFGQNQEADVVLGIPLSTVPLADSQVAEDEPGLLDQIFGNGADGEPGLLDQALTIVVPDPIPPRLNSDANLRAGPSAEYAVVGAASAGDTLELAGQNAAGDWYHLRSGEWIAAFLVDDAPDSLPVVQ